MLSGPACSWPYAYIKWSIVLPAAATSRSFSIAGLRPPCSSTEYFELRACPAVQAYSIRLQGCAYSLQAAIPLAYALLSSITVCNHSASICSMAVLITFLSVLSGSSMLCLRFFVFPGLWLHLSIYCLLIMYGSSHVCWYIA